MACAQHFDTRLADMLEVWDARCIWIGVGIFFGAVLVAEEKKRDCGKSRTGEGQDELGCWIGALQERVTSAILKIVVKSPANVAVKAFSKAVACSSTVCAAIISIWSLVSADMFEV